MKKILITGASSGIGKELAKNLANKSKKLYLLARSSNKLNLLKEELKEGQILQGVLDLYIVDEDKREIYIVDYKTDKILNEEYYKERYNIQIGIYEYSIFKQYGQDYKYNKIIYSTTMKKIIRL